MQQPGFSQKPEDTNICTEPEIEKLNRNLQCQSETQTRFDQKAHAILKDFVCRMKNEFDNNYVCFSGERDAAQLHKIYCSATKHVRANFQHNSKRNTNELKVCLKFCKNIFEIFQQDSREIEKHETELFQEMSIKITGAYLKKISAYLNSIKVDKLEENRLVNLAEVHKILVEQLIKVALDSFNFGNKENFVLELFLNRLQKSLDKLFQEVSTTMSNVSNKEMLQAENSILAYVHCMQDFEHSKNWQNYEEVCDLHSRSLLRVTKMLPNDIREDVKRRIHTYFLYLYQNCTELIDNNTKDSRALCIQLAPEFVQVGFHTISAIEPHRQKFSPHLFILKNDSKTDHLADHHILYHIKHCMVFEDISKHVLVDFFRLNYNEQGKNMAQNIRQVIVIIPSWLSVEQRQFLCYCAKLGGFKQVYLRNESSMAAYHWLKGQKNISVAINYSFVLISIDKVGVQVEIFSLNEQNKLLLLGLSCSCWNEPVLDSHTFFGGSYNVSCKRDLFPENFMMIVNSTFERASNQIPGAYKNLVKACVVKADAKAWIDKVNYLFSEREHLVKINEDFYELAFHSALKFSYSASRIRKEILDYATHRSSSTIPLTSDVRCNAFMQTVEAALKIDCSGNIDEELVHEQKQKLLNKCLDLEDKLKICDINAIVKRKLIKNLNEIQSAEFLNACNKNDLDEKEKMLDKLAAKFISK